MVLLRDAVGVDRGNASSEPRRQFEAIINESRCRHHLPPLSLFKVFGAANLECMKHPRKFNEISQDAEQSSSLMPRKKARPSNSGWISPAQNNHHKISLTVRVFLAFS